MRLDKKHYSNIYIPDGIRWVQSIRSKDATILAYNDIYIGKYELSPDNKFWIWELYGNETYIESGKCLTIEDTHHAMVNRLAFLGWYNFHITL
jgi:hypothetical protein